MRIGVDTSVVLAWLAGERHSPNTGKGIHDIFSGIQSGKYVWICPPILLEEVSPERTLQKHKVDITAAYHAILNHVQFVSYPPEIDEWTDSLRQKYNFSDADAKHVAMAIITKCRYYCTLDRGVLRHAVAIKEMSGSATEIIKPPIPGAFLGA